MNSPRIALIHTGAVVIGPVGDLARAALPDTTFVNYLDDRIVADLSDPARAGSVPERIADLARAAQAGGADLALLTCSSISTLAGPTSEKVGIPVLRIDEAMADHAVSTGARIGVLATLPTTCAPTVSLIEERAALANVSPLVRSEVIEGAFVAVASGDRATHDRLVVEAIERLAPEVDVIVLAQASMASAADAASVNVPVLSSPALGIERLREVATGGSAS